MNYDLLKTCPSIISLSLTILALLPSAFALLNSGYNVFLTLSISSGNCSDTPISWQSVFSDNSNPELSFSEFSETFLKVYNTSFPVKRKVVKTNIDKNKSPWMTKSVLKSVRTKNKLYKAYLLNSNKKNQNSYKKLNHIIKASKKMYYEDQLIKYKHNTKMI